MPVIDGIALYERLRRYPGVHLSLVAPPSHHWLGEPTYTEQGRPVILDGGCGCAGCCGVAARIDLTATTVVWHDFYTLGNRPDLEDLRFEFDRTEYERALFRLPNTRITKAEWLEDR